ncbi:MAG: septation regulator SpoVG [Thermoanaerobaculia bacterium]|nr:septation regulator SpoVG [Thermoanaerobaculia bacterium]
MEITDVRVFAVNDPRVRAYVSVVFDACFMVNDLRIVEGKQGLFVSMPNRRRRNGDFKDIAHPLNQETRRRIEQRVLEEFARVTAGAAGSEESPAAAPRSGAADEPVPPAPEESPAKSMEEIQEAHLRDSFWSLG